MADAIDRLARIARQELRRLQARLTSYQDRIDALDREDAGLLEERAQAREEVRRDPRFAPELDRYEAATALRRQRLAAEREQAERAYHQTEDEVYGAFRRMKTYETIAERRARRLEQERREAERRDEIAVARQRRRPSGRGS
jgi:chromosome segregation ATPase